MHVSRIEPMLSAVISYIYRDSIWRIRYIKGKAIEDCPILWQKLKQFERWCSLLSLSNSLTSLSEVISIAIQSIMAEIKAPSQIYNIVSDIIALAKEVRNTKIMYCNISANRLADSIAKMPHQYTSQSVVIYHQ